MLQRCRTIAAAIPAPRVFDITTPSEAVEIYCVKCRVKTASRDIGVRQWSPIWLPRWSKTVKILLNDHEHFTVYLIKDGEH
jgi:hypothetical protein